MVINLVTKIFIKKFYNEEVLSMNTSNIIIALEIMAKGMAGIFTAILIIILCVWLLGKIGK